MAVPLSAALCQGSFQQLLGVHQLHLEASVQPLMTRHGGMECALFLELRQGTSKMPLNTLEASSIVAPGCHFPRILAKLSHGSSIDRLGQSLTESAWVHVLVWCGLEAFPGIEIAHRAHERW